MWAKNSAKPQFVAYRAERSFLVSFLFFPTLQGSAAVFSAVGLKRTLHLATQRGNRGTGVFSLSPAASEPNSEGSVKSGEKAAKR